MKKIVVLVICFFYMQLAAQEDAWVYLKDKPQSASYLASPLSMLSQRALDRRTRQQIPLDIKDVPIHSSYYTQLKNASGITVLASSKWLNAVHVQGTQTAINDLKTTFAFVDAIEFANKNLQTKSRSTSTSQRVQKIKKFATSATNFDYGNAANQIQMLKGDYLHEQGYTGTGMHIAVIDAGFPNVNTLSAFERIRSNHQILGGYDFVNRNANFYTGHNHGTHVLSDIGGYIENEFVGTAPDASFYLFITEDAANEVPLEESLWVEAAERADSLGVDVINTSLGYSVFFDETKYNYSFEDMDGETAFISKGAAVGASRGMLLVTSAGNEGNDANWNHINAPADVEHVFTVGAVTPSTTIASFSSYGPTADNRVKPDVLAQGQQSAIINYSTGNVSTSNGTSFSSPIMAGVVACLWQAFPNLTNLELMQRIRESADKYDNPTNQHGYGIPNFETAYAAILNTDTQQFLNRLTVFPNPITHQFTIQGAGITLENLHLQLFDILGKKVLDYTQIQTPTIDVSQLHSGIYILKLSKGTHHTTMKLIKR